MAKRRYIAATKNTPAPLCAGGILACAAELRQKRLEALPARARFVANSKAKARARMKRVLALRKKGMTFSQIGARLGMTRKAVSGLCTRAKKIRPAVVATHWWNLRSPAGSESSDHHQSEAPA